MNAIKILTHEISYLKAVLNKNFKIRQEKITTENENKITEVIQAIEDLNDCLILLETKKTIELPVGEDLINKLLEK